LRIKSMTRMSKSQCCGLLTNTSGLQSGPRRGYSGATQIQTEALPLQVLAGLIPCGRI
jgi:hypothetical protein